MLKTKIAKCKNGDSFFFGNTHFLVKEGVGYFSITHTLLKEKDFIVALFWEEVGVASYKNKKYPRLSRFLEKEALKIFQ